MGLRAGGRGRRAIAITVAACAFVDISMINDSKKKKRRSQEVNPPQNRIINFSTPIPLFNTICVAFKTTYLIWREWGAQKL